MSLWSIVLIALGVSADAFAASIASGVKMRTLRYRYVAEIALTFAVFQMVMPLIGWALASQFSAFLAPFDHWVAFGLLGIIGLKMIWDAFHLDDDHTVEDGRVNFRQLLLLGLATSIDAAAIGVSLALLDVSIVQAVLIIGAITFIVAFLGVVLGQKIGSKFRKPAEIIGGLVLIGIGVRILVDHLGGA